MIRRVAVFVGVLALLCGGGYALTQTTNTNTGTKAKADGPVREALKAYADSFNKGDFQSALSFWSEDAELIDDEGNVKDKTGISESLKAICKPDSGNKLSATLKNIKMVGGTVAIVEGQAELTTSEGTETNNFEGVMVFDADSKRWMFSRVRDLPSDDTVKYAAAQEKLKSLDWLVGNWASKEGDQSLTMNVRWMKNRAYLIVEQSITVKDSETLGITMMIGYDPVSQQIHSWVFDTQGGRGEADWTQDGNTWNLTAVGVTADGTEASSTPAWKFIDENTFEWTSINRQVDGQPRPDLKLTYRKVNTLK